jgi:hypothetical protein
MNFALTAFSEVRGAFLDLEMHTGTEGVGKRHRLTDVEPHPTGPEGEEVQPLHSCASQAGRVAVAEARGSGSIASSGPSPASRACSWC